MVYGYICVDAERRAIATFCKQNGIAVDKWISGKLPGTLQKDDILVCLEISRLGRNLPMVVSVLRACVERGVRVWSVRDNYRSFAFAGDIVTIPVISHL
ncbi:MAG: recombinase family protein [Candidatus Fibromonas sp.]|nr:recombinase family protein [Candidatus Fibromonas sp.]